MTDVWRLYDTHARAFDRDRGKTLVERGYLTGLLARLPTEARILDLGCGAGEPIARFLIESGCAVTGVDAAPAMIALCRERFPKGNWIEADMRSLDLGRRFDGLVAWDSFFHLDRAEQRAMFPIFARHVAEGGLLLFTSGPEDSESIGGFYGYALFHASLGPDEYRALLEIAGFRVILHRGRDPACGGHTVWLAQKAGSR